MDTYLQIAQLVLKSTKRPLSARAILDVAYRADIVPQHLYGKTQHKTLQARLSEDILHHREVSSFYRTEPGHFFLTEFLNSNEIPDQWKQPFPARRRTRDLSHAHTLAVKHSFLQKWKHQIADADSFFVKAEAAGAVAYMHPDEMDKRGYCSAWTFAMVMKDEDALAYRIGRYRDDRETFAKRRSIGFPGALTVDNVTLFSHDRVGAEECATTILTQDLDLSLASFDGPGCKRPNVQYVMIVEDQNRDGFDVVVVLAWECPKWFEPTTRRLSLNDPHWLNRTVRHNNLDDFEPWSSAILSFWASRAETPIGCKKTHF